MVTLQKVAAAASVAFAIRDMVGSVEKTSAGNIAFQSVVDSWYTYAIIYITRI